MAASAEPSPAPEEARESLLADIAPLAMLDSPNDPETDDLADAGHPNPQISSPQESSGRLKRAARGILKPLIAMATAQYFIVAVLGGLAAWAISAKATEAINTKLAPLLTALKRF